MAKQTINIGSSPNDGTGTPLRTAFDYCNLNFTELYTAVGPSGNNIVCPGSATITGNLTVDTNTLFVDAANDRVGIGTASPAAGAKLSVLGTTVVSASDFTNASTWSARFQAAANSQPSGIFLSGLTSGGQVVPGSLHVEPVAASSRSALIATYSADSSVGYFAINRFSPSAGTTSQHYKIDDTGVATWSNVGGVAGTAMTLNSTGLGVGVTPSAWGSNSKALQVGIGSGAISSTGAGSTASRFTHGCYFDNTNWKYQFSSVGASLYEVTGANSGSTHAWYIAPGGAANANITFTQAMTLDASGNLLVGTTTNTNGSRVFARGTGGATTLAIQSSTGDTANPGLLVGKFDNDSTTSQILVRFTINNNSAGSGQINANGASQAAFGSFSDSRLKENILSLPSQLANILSLRPVEFDYKDGSGHQIGFVAQEMQEVYSDAVGEQNGFLTVTGWSKTEARLVSAIKELAAKVQALEAKLA